jgi:FkbM family methyltransferase
MPEVPGQPVWVTLASSIIRRLPRGRYRAANWVGGHPVRPFWSRMADDLGASWFRCDLRDGIMRDVCLTGRYEPQETALLQRILAKGMTFVDVGANWGYFTLIGARLVGPSGHVVSVEADPAACAALRANCARNELDWVTVLEMAASDRPGTLSFQQYDANATESGNYGLATTTTVVVNGRRLGVTGRALDEALDGLNVDRVDLLKMDIEGGEGRALTGMGRRLAGHRVSWILLEVHPSHLRDQGSSAEQVVNELRGYGYEPWSIDHSVSATQRVVAGRLEVTDLLTPLVDAGNLGSWPHVLWTLDHDGAARRPTSR